MSTIQTVIRSEPFFVRGEAFTGTEGNYILQHHQQEIERLQKQHNFILSSTGGVLVTAPLNGNNTLRVLDSGAADGESLDLVSYEKIRITKRGNRDMAPITSATLSF